MTALELFLLIMVSGLILVGAGYHFGRIEGHHVGHTNGFEAGYGAALKDVRLGVASGLTPSRAVDAIARLREPMQRFAATLGSKN